ncbi:diguanylate cyclase (GGDEF)-like protein/PAS domain S-box-containing protein [Actinoplanes lutulentus]|uniref:PAS domain S-box-containing protein/diguanylate cyclase (GGDEF)-like protein n=1 Tax=Actinoplanes lutulentus TaxID=1287878 RepID=A0A327Z8E0_9ACTN|nr:EAL domain-containing protein [Actinoplanes lutulentus]MBB2949231.1 diguanylate cyclase (GGDEF)-like protein/PAS domain S-box-containing protein [Actinoplanes lutulentus]RAK34619.1 PAS domain S-box-containing protein/diguanylate cyclase (GGDEF)-like protein [Actinoplanes lutulentus]
MQTRVVRACFAAWVVVLTGLYYMFPDAHLYTWAALGYSCAAMVLAGVRLHQPARRLPWYLISAALAFFTTGDTWYNLVLAMGEQPDFPGLADLFYLLVYPLLTAGLLIFVRARSGGGDKAALLDALVPTVGLGLLAWVYWIAPFTRSAELSALEKIVSIGYPLGDVLVLAMILRMLTGSGKKPRAVGVIGVAMVGLLISDIFYGQSQLNSAWELGGPVDFGWIVFYSSMAFAALHPSMGLLTEPAARTAETGMGRHRLFWLSAAALIAPGVLALEYAQGKEVEISRGGVVDAPVIAAAAALMFLLVLARVGDLAWAQRQASARERALREAGTALFAATNAKDLAAGVREAIARLMPADKPYHLQLAAPQTGDAEVALRWVAAADLPDHVSSGGFANTLFCPQQLPGGRFGIIVLGAPDAVLRAVQGSIETLSSQIAVVLDRISLTEEVSRRDSEAYFRTLIQSAADVIMIVDEDGVIRYASPSAGNLFDGDDPTDGVFANLFAPDAQDALRVAVARIAHGSGDLEGVALAALRGERRVEIECDMRDLREDPTVRGLVVTMRDVTEQRRLEDDLTHQAYHDSLTGLANRVLFRNRLEQAFSLAALSDATLGVLFIDLDDFKEINDTLGHAVGDQLLITVAQRISAVIGAGGTAARMGGDEFAVMVAPSHNADAAEDVAARLVAALAAPIELADGEGGTHLVSGAASVGVATNLDATSATELLRHADLALYLAKGLGKGGWQRYQNDLHTAMVQRLEMRTQLIEAIEGEQFVLQYQPIVELADQRITGVEALVRWQHPVRGLLGPYHFIEAAEESGAIVGIGTWVMREALRQFAQWRASGSTTLRYVSVNVSPRQFRSPDFADVVRQALADAGARPEWLLLEITESLVLRDAEKVLADLKALRALGVRVAIDDFGTGYSSLSYLRQMPVDVLKLDKSFIDDILHSRQQHALVDAIVTLAGNLDLSVVAEGIEESGQHTALDTMGCQYGQGYLFAKPQWPADIPALTEASATLAALS